MTLIYGVFSFWAHNDSVWVQILAQIETDWACQVLPSVGKTS